MAVVTTKYVDTRKKGVVSRSQSENASVPDRKECAALDAIDDTSDFCDCLEICDAGRFESCCVTGSTLFMYSLLLVPKGEDYVEE